MEAVKLFEYMNEAGVTPDQRSFELMISAHVVNRDVQSASAILTAMVSAVLTRRTELFEGSIGKRISNFFSSFSVRVVC